MQEKKQTSGITEKARSIYQRNCEIVIVKAALLKVKNRTVNATLIIRKQMPEYVSSTMHVFRGEKYRLLLRGGPTHRKGNGHKKYDLTVNVTVTDL